MPIILGPIFSGRSTNITNGTQIIINHDAAQRPSTPDMGEDVNIAGETFVEPAESNEDLLAGLLADELED